MKTKSGKMQNIRSAIRAGHAAGSRWVLASPCLLVLALGAAQGCTDEQAAPAAPEGTTTRSALVGGTLDSTQVPNVGEINGECAATLVAGQWVLTAGHCVNLSNQNPSPGYAFDTADVYAAGKTISARSAAIYNLAPQFLNTSADMTSFMFNFNNSPTTHAGNPDVALVMLTQPIPDPSTSTVTSRVSLATVMPSAGGPITTWGYGSTSHNFNFLRNFINWSYSPPSGLVCSEPYDPNCHNGTELYNQSWGNPGDSGGPSFMNGGETIFGVTSMNDGGKLLLGDVEYLRPQLCNIMYNHPHRFCVMGPPLGGEPGGCGPYVPGTTTNVETYVVNEDQWCGTQWWDQICVNEASDAAAWQDKVSCLMEKGSVLSGPTDILLAGYFTDQYAGVLAPAALSGAGDGTFYGAAFYYDDPHFSTYSAESGVHALAGDFNGDGFNDIALVSTNPSNQWNMIPIAFSQTITTGMLHASYMPVGGVSGVSGSNVDPFRCGGVTTPSFAGWAAKCTGAVPVSGDFDGDGMTDIALVGSDYFLTTSTGCTSTLPAGSCGALPVAFSNGDGSFRVTAIPDYDSATYRVAGNPGAVAFQNAKARYAIPVVGDFDGDGKSDIAWMQGEDNTGRATSNIPVALSNGDGTFRMLYTTVNSGTFLKDAVAGHVTTVVGDFNGDGFSDIALVGNGAWTTIPIAFSNGSSKSLSFTFVNSIVTDTSFLYWAASPGAKAVVGDFNSDGRSDVALTGTSGWTTIPVAFSQSDGTFTIVNNPVDLTTFGRNVPLDATASVAVPIAAQY